MSDPGPTPVISETEGVPTQSVSGIEEDAPELGRALRDEPGDGVATAADPMPDMAGTDPTRDRSG
jgi:hypothetical protein